LPRGSGATVGYHNWGHPDYGPKLPRITQTLGSSLLQVQEAQHHGTAISRPRQSWGELCLARGLPAEAPRSAGNLRLARDPLSRALCRASTRGETPPRSRPPSADCGSGPTTQRDGTHSFANHSTAWGGSQMESGGVSQRRSPCHTADVTGVPSACSGPCAAIPSAVQVCGTLCGLA